MDVTHVLEGYLFVWDSEKAETNWQKHGVSFEQACEVFLDDFYKMYPEIHENEERWMIMGHSYLAHPIKPLYVVAVEKGQDTWRIISARFASPAERRRYEEEDDTD
jgi:uncharacterized DUF497 family protein